MEKTEIKTEEKPKTKNVHCKKCKDKLFKTNVCTISTDVQGKIPDSKGDLVEYKSWYFLKDMFDFDNISFSKIVPEENVRFLSCGTCESGALGYSFENSKKFYISTDLVEEK